MSESLTPSDIIPTEVYNDIMNEVDENLLNIMNQDPQNEQENYTEDNKSFIWQDGLQSSEQYANPQQQLMYGIPTVPQIPATDDYIGELDFNISFTSHIDKKNSSLYSSDLNKIFIKVQDILPINVKRKTTSDDLYLRATLVYSLPQFAQNLVERCPIHADPKLEMNKNLEPVIMRHVLHCTNPGSMYMGNPEHKEHLSVVTKLAQPQAGVDTVRVNYMFMCKNSCPSGMNRRTVDIIFTLENINGQVFGRKKFLVKICSSPKRDKDKEEKESRENFPPQHTSHGKKRKSNLPTENQTTDDEVFNFPSFKIVGASNMRAILKFARDRMFTDLHFKEYDEGKKTIIEESVKQLNELLKNLSPE